MLLPIICQNIKIDACVVDAQLALQTRPDIRLRQRPTAGQTGQTGRDRTGQDGTGQDGTGRDRIGQDRQNRQTHTHLTQLSQCTRQPLQLVITFPIFVLQLI